MRNSARIITRSCAYTNAVVPFNRSKGIFRFGWMSLTFFRWLFLPPYHHGLRLDIASAEPLAYTMEFMTCDSLRTIQESLKSKLTTLHNEAGVCHGNITAQNILLLKNGERNQALLSSFTEARFKVDAENSAS